MRMIGLALFGLLIAAGVGGGAWLYRTEQAAAQAAALEKEQPPETLAPPSIESSAPYPATALSPEPIRTAESDETLPVAVRPKSFSPEELVRWALGLKQREAALQQREDSMLRAEMRQKLVRADIEGEQQEVEGLYNQSRDQRQAVETLLKEADLKLQALVAKSAELQTQTENAAAANSGQDSERAANIEKMALVVQGMDPQKSADMLKGLANDGKLDMVVELLHKLEEKKASAVIEALQDPQLISEVLEKYVERKSPQPVVKKRR